jgi:hypothetical protein
MKTRLLILALGLLLLLPLAAWAKDSEARREIRVRDDAGQSRIVVRSDDDVVVLDEEDLEAMLEGLEDLGPAIESALESALAQIERANFRIERDDDSDDSHFHGRNMSEQEWEEWSEQLAERMESMDSRIRERVERAVRAAPRAERMGGFDSSAEREELEAEIRELRSEIRRLESELEELRKDG